MGEPYLGEIRMFGGSYAPIGWALCDGRLLPISQNSSLFSLLGTTYGGDGKTTFGLPNLQGRAPMHWGDGPGLTPRRLGEAGGESAVTLLANQMPSHQHGASVSAASPDQSTPAGNVPAAATLYTAPPGASQLSSGSIVQTGGSQPHDNMQPYLSVTFIIATQGVYPSRT